MLLNVNCKKVTYGMDNPMFMAIRITGNKLIASGAECHCGAIDCSHDWKGIVYRVLLCKNW